MLLLPPVTKGKTWVRHIVPISGKDSLATAIVMRLWFPEKSLEYFYNQVEKELPEIYDWLNRVEAYLGKSIYRIGSDLNAIIKEQGVLPADNMRYCTRLAKIEPMERFIGTNPAFVYFGIRADEKRIGYRPVGKALIQPIYPLQLLGLGLDDVWKLCESVSLLPPTFFWQELYNRVAAIVPNELLQQLKSYQRAMLFSWRSRPNCYDCFYQRQYEYIGLREHHPLLFEQMCVMEETTGAEKYTIRQGYKMRELPARRDEILERRVTEVSETIFSMFGYSRAARKKDRAYQKVLFFDSLNDSLVKTSCGLFCGK